MIGPYQRTGRKYGLILGLANFNSVYDVREKCEDSGISLCSISDTQGIFGIP